jgi:hypothetical protein
MSLRESSGFTDVMAGHNCCNPGPTDLLRVALIGAMQARQLYIHDPPSHRYGDVYGQHDFIRLDEESEQDLLRGSTEAFFKWRRSCIAIARTALGWAESQHQGRQ